MEVEKIEEIKAHLNDFWNDQAIAVDADSTSIDELVAAMDSKTAVEALIKVEEIVGIELPVGEVIQQGGYNSREEFIEQVTSSVVKYVEDKKS
ncbi:hypothetical protein NWF24_30810 [Variovorax paradoxus]|uniref:hypothetical protein n=1 Tax=Variovorax paradoxus TaxID=34073 RepID=UPI0021AD4F5F|nr:hypothetical protein [Variovorax paradoxus]UVH57181.1 hypothetical protein NWF24_30810 [Variovorax paradoxus]